MDILEVLYRASLSTKIAEDLTGRVLGLQIGICYDTSDPLGLGRIRVLEPSKGAKSYSDWMYRYQPLTNLSTPVPSPGSTVIYLYVDGNPHQGIYLGTIHNQLNPVKSESLRVQVGESVLELSDGKLTITGVAEVTINGKAVTTIGARDTRGDTLTTKGY